MTSLRERKKENRKNRIFEAALKLFEELGYEKTTMEKIANESNLGVGTLYNYFPSKLVLLFSIIEAGAGTYLEELDIALSGSGSLKETLNTFFAIYFKSFSTYGKKVWSELFISALFRQPDMDYMIDTIDKQYIDKLIELLLEYRNRGVLKAEADLSIAASALYAILTYHIIRYISDSDLSLSELMPQLSAQAGLIIDGLLNG